MKSISVKVPLAVYQNFRQKILYEKDATITSVLTTFIDAYSKGELSLAERRWMINDSKKD